MDEPPINDRPMVPPATGELRPEKEGDSSDRGRPQPAAAEVESARLLANQARDQLLRRGLADQDIDRLADAYVAQDLGETVEGFVAWAAKKRPRTT
jgi:hypothetical protein